MKKVLKAFILLLLLAITGILIELIAFRGRTPAIRGSRDGIASLETVCLGGSDQWILIRGRHKSAPVILFLHGGPGMPAMFLAHAFQRPLENDFVVVHWDRRGAGKSYSAGTTGEITVRKTLDETFELTRMLQKRFNRERIYLAAHSWGTMLGLLACREHPEYYSASIGMGQLASSEEQVTAARKDYLLPKARSAGDADLMARLNDKDPQIDEDDLFRYHAELYGSESVWPILFTGLRAPEYNLRDILNVKKGADLVMHKMRQDVLRGTLEEEVLEIPVPVFFFLGRYDYNTPSSLAERYLNELQAPLKRVVWFEKSAHFPFFEEPVFFHRQMLAMEAEVNRFWSKSLTNP